MFAGMGPLLGCFAQLALGDVAYYGAAYGRVVGVPRYGRFHPRPEYRFVLFRHPQFAYLPRFRFKKLFEVLVVDVLVFLENELGDRLPGQRVTSDTQKGGGYPKSS